MDNYLFSNQLATKFRNQWVLLITLALLGFATCSCSTPIFQPPATPVPPTPTPTPIPEETLLGAFIEGGTGGFSYRWLAYIVYPPEDAANQDIYVEINGNKLGPYEGVGRRFETSPDGEHIAFAALKEGKWWIVVDGQEKWAVDGLGWAWYAWTADLEGKTYVPQTQSPIMLFSRDGESLAYMVSLGETGWSIHVNGEPGPTFDNIPIEIGFIDNKVFYQAGNTEGGFFIHGDNSFGPYGIIFPVARSHNEEHFAFGALKEAQNINVLVVDGVERTLTGSLQTIEIGNNGELFYTQKTAGRVRAYFMDQELPGDYDEIKFFNLSPDGKHYAFWGRQGVYWSLVTDQNRFANYDGYYFYKMGNQTYTSLWDQASENLAYFAREGERISLYLNGNITDMPEIPGISLTVYIDDAGNHVGVDRMGGPIFNRQAFVECLKQKANLNCDPVTVSLIGDQLAFFEKGTSESYMVIGTRKEGPYLELKSVLFVTPDQKHYAYFVKTAAGDQLVLDGKLIERVYEGFYMPKMTDFGLQCLALKAGQIYSIFNAWP